MRHMGYLIKEYKIFIINDQQRFLLDTISKHLEKKSTTIGIDRSRRQIARWCLKNSIETLRNAGIKIWC